MNKTWMEKNGEKVETACVVFGTALIGMLAYCIGTVIYGRGVKAGTTRSVEVLDRVGVFDNIDRDALAAKIKQEFNV